MQSRIKTFFTLIVLLSSISFPIEAHAGLTKLIVDGIENQSSGIWNVSTENWTLEVGVLAVCFEKGKVRIEFVYTSNNEDFYKQVFSDGNRKPLGFEIDILDFSGIVTQSEMYPNEDNLPDDAQYEDVTFGDDDNRTLTVAIADPTKLEAGKLYWAEFTCPILTLMDSAELSVRVQLTGDFQKLFDEQLYLYEEYPDWTRIPLGTWLGLTNPEPANQFFVIQKPDERLYEKFERFGTTLVRWMGINESDKYSHSYSCDIFPFLAVYGGSVGINSETEEDECASDFVDNPPDSEDSETQENWYNEGIYNPPVSTTVESGDPDFVVREVYIDHHKKILRPHEDIEIFTRIKNKGDDDTSKDIGLKYWRSDGEKIDSKDDRVRIGTDNIRGENLLPGESKWESKHTEAPSTPGTYNFTVEVDYEDDIDEVHESNNKFDPPFVFEVKKPQLFLTSFSIVEGITVFAPGNIFQVRAFTENEGAEPGPDVKLYYYLDGVKIGEDNMRDYNLAPKEENIYIVVPQAPGPHVLAVWIDPTNNVDEGNENDNYAEITLIVNNLTIQINEPLSPVINFILVK